MAVDGLEGRVAIVTGGSSGIGRATARRLAADGAIVVACDIRPPAGDDVEPRATFRDVDVRSQDSVDALVSGVLAEHGRIDVLANVAGVMDGYLPVHELDDGTWREVLGVNVDGPMRLCRAVIPTMLANRSGAIVNVASVAGIRGGAAGTAYTVAKHAAIGLTRSIAWMYAYEGIRCNAVLPGGTDTPIARDVVVRSEWAHRRVRPVLRQGVRMADAGELARVIAFLASDGASNVNGALLTSDAGWSAG